MNLNLPQSKRRMGLIHHTARNGGKGYKIKHRRSTLLSHFEKSSPFTVYTEVASKAQQQHSMRVSFDTESVEVGIDKLCSQII